MPGAPASTPASPLRVFAAAVVRPSLPAAVGALVVAGLWLVLCAWLVAPRNLAQLDPGMLMTRPRDDYAFLTIGAMKLAFPDDDAPGEVFAPDTETTIVMLSASALKHAVIDERDLTAALTERVGRPVRFVNLSSGGFSLWEMASVAGWLEHRPNTIFLFGVGDWQFAQAPEGLVELRDQPRIGLSSDAFDEELRLAGLDLPLRSGNYFIDHAKFFLARLGALKHFVVGPLTPIRYNDNHRRIEEDVWDEKMAGFGEEYFVGAETHGPANLAVLERLIDRVRSSPAGQDVVLIRSPLNPRSVAVFDQKTISFAREALDTVAAERGVTVLRLNEAAGLSDEHFYDYCHIQDKPTRERFSALLVDALAGFLLAPDTARTAEGGAP